MRPSALTKVQQLSRRERRLLLMALALLPVAVVRTRISRRVPPDVAPDAPPSAGQEPAPAVVAETARMVKAAARVVWGASCLPQSVVVHRLLRREGIATTIRIGVRKSSHALEAHAWVEYAGRPITDPATVHQQFTVLAADSRS
jgi:hypothetical protein